MGKVAQVPPFLGDDAVIGGDDPGVVEVGLGQLQARPADATAATRSATRRWAASICKVPTFASSRAARASATACRLAQLLGGGLDLVAARLGLGLPGLGGGTSAFAE